MELDGCVIAVKPSKLLRPTIFEIYTALYHLIWTTGSVDAPAPDQGPTLVLHGHVDISLPWRGRTNRNVIKHENKTIMLSRRRPENGARVFNSHTRTRTRRFTYRDRTTSIRVRGHVLTNKTFAGSVRSFRTLTTFLS